MSIKPGCKRVMVLSAIATHPLNAGHRVRIFRMLEDLAGLGHEIHFVYLNGKCQPGDADEEAMKRHWGNRFYRPLFKELDNFFSRHGASSLEGVRECQVDDWYDDSFSGVLKKLAEKIQPDVVLAEYIMLSKGFEVFGRNVLKILDTHDVFASRNQKLEQNGIFYHEITPSFTVEDEARALNRADIVLAIQEREKEYFEKMTSKEVRVLGHRADLYEPAPLAKEKNMLFVGGRGLINKTNVENFIQNIFPKIRAQEPEAKLLIAGNICTLLRSLPQGCVELGYAENLRPFYEKARVVVSSDRFATGLSIKTITGLGHTKPLVATPAAVRGLERGAGKAFFTAETPEAFSDSVIRIFKNSDQAKKMAQEAYQFVLDYNQRYQDTLSRLFA